MISRKGAFGYKRPYIQLVLLCVLYSGLRLKPASFFHLLTKVDLVECLNRHFADDCDSLKLSSGEGYVAPAVRGEFRLFYRLRTRSAKHLAVGDSSGALCL